MAPTPLTALMPVQVIVAGYGEVHAKYVEPQGNLSVWAIHMQGRAPWFEVSTRDRTLAGVSLHTVAEIWTLARGRRVGEWLKALAALCEPTTDAGTS